jgi:hypothetical protein
MMRMRKTHFSSNGVLKTNESPYLYRREIHLNHNPSERPSLTVSGKLKQKENLIFGGAPNFDKLKPDDRGGKNTLSTEEMKSFMEEQYRKEEKKKNKQKTPSNEEIREHLRMIIKYHKKEVDDLMPSAYPLLGQANNEEENQEGSAHTGTAVSDTQIRSVQKTSGRKRKIPSAAERGTPAKPKRGKKK